MKDGFGRNIDYLRISVTDRCNERCVYCMPECGISCIKHDDILSYEQIAFVAKTFAKVGIKTVRLTGGDPLVRKNLSTLVKMLKESSSVEKVFLTTNGIALENQLKNLLSAGIDGINISLDSLSSEVYSKITRRPKDAEDVKNIIKNIDTLCDFKKSNPSFLLKINCVLSGLNNSELIPIAKLAKDRDIRVRFIELMPIGQGLLLSKNFIREDEVIKIFEKEFGKLTSCDKVRYNYFKIEGFKGTLGFISPVSHKFCATCNRLRLTSDGFLKSCLQYDEGLSIKPFISDFTEQSEKDLLNALDLVVKNKPKQNSFLENALICDKLKNDSICDKDIKEKIIKNEKRLMSQIGG